MIAQPSMRLDDPRLAKLITDLVDRRVAAAMTRLPATRYGTVAAVDPVARTVSVLLGGSSVPSPGFIYAGAAPAIGGLVRVVIAGADRYVDADLAAVASRGLHFVPVARIQIFAGATASASVSRRLTPAIAGIPADAELLAGQMDASTTTIVASTSFTLFHTEAGSNDVGAIISAAEAARVIRSGFLVGCVQSGGAKLSYNVTVGGGTVTYSLYVTGYWTALNA